MRKFGVAGLGLIGGSIASALKKQGYRVVGVENDPDVSAFALRNGIVDEIGGIEALRGAETVFVCVPVGRTRETVEKIASVVGNETLVTDVASVKGEMKGVGGRFVGGHPMAGTEKSGIAAARAHLFENAFYAIVPYENTSEADVKYITDLVKSFGAKPVIMTADEHDGRVSEVSHLPHMIAYALAGYALKADGFAGTGFLDTTRIAASDPGFWTEVAFLNRENLLEDMRGYEAEFGKYLAALDNGDKEGLKALIAAAKEKREALAQKRVYQNEYTLDLDVRDELGAIARVSKVLADNGVNISGIQIINSREGVGGALRIAIRSEAEYERAKALLCDNETEDENEIS